MSLWIALLRCVDLNAWESEICLHCITDDAWWNFHVWKFHKLMGDLIGIGSLEDHKGFGAATPVLGARAATGLVYPRRAWSTQLGLWFCELLHAASLLSLSVSVACQVDVAASMSWRHVDLSKTPPLAVTRPNWAGTDRTQPLSTRFASCDGIFFIIWH